MTDVAPAPVLRSIAHAALVTPSPLERYRPLLSRRSTHGTTTLVSDGDVGPDFNHVVVLGPTTPKDIFTLATAFFDDPAGYSIVVDVTAAPDVGDLLIARGWRLDEEEPALVLFPLPDAAPPLPPDLDIRLVVDAAGLDAFATVSETPSTYLPSVAAALDPDVALFVGYHGGRAVATARLTCLGGIAEINGVVAAPEQRRRGYGAALTWRAIEAGRARGCAAATLTATEMGYPLYLSLGFQLAGLHRTYLPPERAPSGPR